MSTCNYQNGSHTRSSRGHDSIDSITASQHELIQNGVPQSYVGALLDHDYMNALISTTEGLHGKRRRKIQRYYHMNQIIFGFLAVQAIFGLLIALYKTLLQPDKFYSATAIVDNVDMVVMLDGSRQLREKMDNQHGVATNFTTELHRAVQARKENLINKAKQSIRDREERDRSHLFGFISSLITTRPKELLEDGGKYRIQTGTYNAKATTTHHQFSSDVGNLKENLMQVSPDSYVKHARMMSALEKCSESMPKEPAAQNGQAGKKRYCVIFADNQAMCDKHEAKSFDPICTKWPSLCPADAERYSDGVLLEYGHELRTCSDYARRLEDEQNIEVIMMLTSGSDKEAQRRLQSKGFLNFIKGATKCSISVANESVQVNDDCSRFIVAKDFEELTEKSRKLADLLESEQKTRSKPLDRIDWRYLLFLLLPLNFLLYIIWSYIVKLASQMQSTAAAAIGAKKKMIKVTKTLVEKERTSFVGLPAEVQLTEVELAEVEANRPLIGFNEMMTLRARLKGGYLRQNEDGGVDGHGYALTNDAYFTFGSAEDIDLHVNNLQIGMRIHIRNAGGNSMTVDGDLARFADADQNPGDVAEFVVESMDGTDELDQVDCHLGDIVRLRCCGTGQYLRVDKDGSCSGFGDASELETQIVIDRGGHGIQAGSIVQITSLATRELVRIDAKSKVHASKTSGHCQYWLLEKANHSDENEDEQVKQLSTTARASHLKHGDVVTLKGINQHMLEVDKAGRCRCGPPAESNMGDPSASSSNSSFSEGVEPWQLEDSVFEFIVERVGLDLSKKRDKTVRVGTEIMLRPNVPEGTGAPYVRVNRQGFLGADGRVTNGQAIVFSLAGANMQDMIRPLSKAMAKGDATLKVQSLWNKKEIKNIDASSAAWTTKGDLSQFKGHCVIASPYGQYTVPKIREGESDQWVAVVQEGMDLKRAAQAAKAQGASGIIVRCSGELSLQKLAKAAEGDAPELPTVFVGGTAAAAFEERGLVLQGTEHRSEYLGDAMSSITTGYSSAKKGNLFENVGNALMEFGVWKPEEEAPTETVQTEPEKESQYRWKVVSNTTYMWGRSGGGGATMMKVNYGKAAPPSAQRKTMVDAEDNEVKIIDASQSHNNVRRKSFKQEYTKSTINEVQSGISRRTSIGLIDADDMQARRINNELCEVLTQAEAAQIDREKLAEESDFKIEYKLEEVEVPLNANEDDLADEELIEEMGTFVGTITVPMKQFWLVVTGLVVSTLFLGLIIFYFLCTGRAEDDLIKVVSINAADVSSSMAHSVGKVVIA